MNKPARKSVRVRWIVLTGQFNSSSNKNYVGTKFSCLKYDLQCTNFVPDKTYNTTIYMWPAKTQVSLCIDPLDKASFLHTVRSVKGLNRMCCWSRTVYSALDSPAIDGKYDQRMLLSECAGAYQGWQNAGKYEYFPCRWYLPANTGKCRQILEIGIYHPGSKTKPYPQYQPMDNVCNRGYIVDLVFTLYWLQFNSGLSLL